jgi:hypothetical protein
MTLRYPSIVDTERSLLNYSRLLAPPKYRRAQSITHAASADSADSEVGPVCEVIACFQHHYSAQPTCSGLQATRDQQISRTTPELFTLFICQVAKTELTT